MCLPVKCLHSITASTYCNVKTWRQRRCTEKESKSFADDAVNGDTTLYTWAYYSIPLHHSGVLFLLLDFKKALKNVQYLRNEVTKSDMKHAFKYK